MIGIDSGGNVLRKFFLTICFLLMFGGRMLFAQQVQELDFVRAGHRLELRLPYQRNMNNIWVFDEDTALALKILEISVDGEQIFPEFDPILRDYIFSMRIRNTRRGVNVYYMRMVWLLVNSDNVRKFVWNDLRSIDSYIIREGSRNLFIRYKVVFPFPFVTMRRLRNNAPEDAYSEEYCVSVDLSNAFR
jgi:hypothetical protein